MTLGLNTISHKNPTADEPVHLTRGITLWQGGDFRFQQEHTPLSHWLIGSLAHTLPNLPQVHDLPGWASRERLPAAEALVWQSGLDVQQLFWLGRLPILLLALLSGAVLIRWASDLGGRWAGLSAGALFAFEPNLLAHASLATTDLTAAAGYLLALFTLWRYTQKPTAGRAAAAGLALGVGVAAKMTGALLVPLTLIIVWIALRRTSLSTKIRHLSGFVLLAGMVVWGAYKLSAGPVTFPTLDLTVPLLGPAYWESLVGVNSHISGGHQAFFWGAIDSEGWLAYFPVAFLFKTPLLTLTALPLTLVLTTRQKRWSKTMTLWLPALVLFAFAVLSRLNIGYRHILPIVPLLIVWSAAATAPLIAKLKYARPLWITAMILYAATQLWIHPHHLAYFNWLAGGPAGGARYLGDSNLDWGQDWLTARRYVDQQGIINPVVLPFGFIDPAYYGLQEQTILDENGEMRPWFSPANPAPATYFLSVNALQGLLAEPDLLDFFRRREPDARRATGYSIYKYVIDQQASGSWIGHCTLPGPLLEPAVAEQIVGYTDLRHVYFDCRRSWVFPDQGGPGWIIVPQNQAVPADWLTDSAGEALAHVYAHRATSAAPAYDVYYWSGEADPAAWLTSTLNLTDQPLLTPVGATALSPGRWVTGWQIEAVTTETISIFAHLYGTEPTPAAVDDGLGLAVDQWQPGDLLLQFHTFDAVVDAPSLQTGPYNFVTGERAATPTAYDFEQAKR